MPSKGSRRGKRWREGRALRDAGCDTSETVHEWPDGWTVRLLTTDAHVRYEGRLMRHSLKDGPQKLGPDALELIPIVSLRDPRNHPHVTGLMFAQTPGGFTNDGHQLWCWGRANSDPKPGYLDMLAEWADDAIDQPVVIVAGAAKLETLSRWRPE